MGIFATLKYIIPYSELYDRAHLKAITESLMWLGENMNPERVPALIRLIEPETIRTRSALDLKNYIDKFREQYKLYVVLILGRCGIETNMEVDTQTKKSRNLTHVHIK